MRHALHPRKYYMWYATKYRPLGKAMSCLFPTSFELQDGEEVAMGLGTPTAFEKVLGKASLHYTSLCLVSFVRLLNPTPQPRLK